MYYFPETCTQHYYTHCQNTGNRQQQQSRRNCPLYPSHHSRFSFSSFPFALFILDPPLLLSPTHTCMSLSLSLSFTFHVVLLILLLLLLLSSSPSSIVLKSFWSHKSSLHQNKTKEEETETVGFSQKETRCLLRKQKNNSSYS